MMNSRTDREQSTQALATKLVNRLSTHQDAPCFIVAPPQCGQQELLTLFSKAVPERLLLSRYKVDVEGQCHLLDEQSILGGDNSMLAGQDITACHHGSPHATQGTSTMSQGKHPTAQSLLKEKQVLQTQSFANTTKSLALLLPLPWLDDTAAQRFSDALDALVASGQQTIVLCSAQNDRYQNLQSDRLEITVSELRESGILPCSAYGASLACFLDEFLPVQIRLAAALIACLGTVSNNELVALGYKLSADVLHVLTSLSPLFSLDETGQQVLTGRMDPHSFSSGLVQVIREYLCEQDAVSDNAAIAARITALSIYLLERDDLESSHQVLDIAESLIKQSAQESRPEHTLDTTLPLFAGLSKRSKVNSTYTQEQLGQGSFVEQRNSPRIVISDVAQKTPQVEPIYLNLFGEFKVIHAEKPLCNKHLSRSKVKRLMSYLALNQQRMVSREVIIDYLWPHLDFERAQKNLYTSWCMLAKGLGSESSKECPYIQRRGELYQINAEYVTCDTRLFEQIAREVLLGRNELPAQLESLMQMESLYKNALVADLPVDSFISSKEKALRSLMVDSFLVVIRQLREAEEIEKAVFFARVAYELDETREDVYRELMDTQNMAGQRTSAMQTYFSCKQYLLDELGILPSRSTTALYQDLLLDSCR